MHISDFINRTPYRRLFQNEIVNLQEPIVIGKIFFSEKIPFVMPLDTIGCIFENLSLLQLKTLACVNKSWLAAYKKFKHLSIIKQACSIHNLFNSVLLEDESKYPLLPPLSFPPSTKNLSDIKNVARVWIYEYVSWLANPVNKVSVAALAKNLSKNEAISDFFALHLMCAKFRPLETFNNFYTDFYHLSGTLDLLELLKKAAAKDFIPYYQHPLFSLLIEAYVVEMLKNVQGEDLTLDHWYIYIKFINTSPLLSPLLSQSLLKGADITCDYMRFALLCAHPLFAQERDSAIECFKKKSNVQLVNFLIKHVERRNEIGQLEHIHEVYDKIIADDAWKDRVSLIPSSPFLDLENKRIIYIIQKLTLAGIFLPTLALMPLIITCIIRPSEELKILTPILSVAALIATVVSALLFHNINNYSKIVDEKHDLHIV